MLGADVGTALMAVVFSFDLSWLSPLLIFVGVVVFISREKTTAGRLGRVLIGLGLMLLALQLIVGATKPLTESPAVRALLAALPSEVLLDIAGRRVLLTVAVVLEPGDRAAHRHAGGVGPGADDGGARPGARRQPRQRPAGRAADRARADGRAPAAARQPAVQADRRGRGDPAAAVCPRAGCSRRAAACTSRWCCSTSASTWRWRCCSSASPAPWRGCSNAGCSRRRRAACTSGRSTSTRRRWPRRRWPSAAPRARRCTRPTWSRRCCAASCR